MIQGNLPRSATTNRHTLFKVDDSQVAIPVQPITGSWGEEVIQPKQLTLPIEIMVAWASNQTLLFYQFPVAIH